MTGSCGLGTSPGEKSWGRCWQVAQVGGRSQTFHCSEVYNTAHKNHNCHAIYCSMEVCSLTGECLPSVTAQGWSRTASSTGGWPLLNSSQATPQPSHAVICSTLFASPEETHRVVPRQNLLEARLLVQFSRRPTRWDESMQGGRSGSMTRACLAPPPRKGRKAPGGDGRLIL